MDSASRAVRVGQAPPVVDGFAADYWDCFRIETVATSHSARDWASRSLRGAEAAHGAFGRIAWQGILGFRLAPGAPGTLVGWPVEVERPEHLLLRADGSLMQGQLDFAVRGPHVVWTTMLRFHGRAGRMVWAAAGHVHRAMAPRCLTAARQSLLRADPT